MTVPASPPARDFGGSGLLLVVLLGVAIVSLLATGVSTDLTDPFDQAVIDVVRADSLQPLLSPLRWVTELGSTRAVILVAVITFLVGLVIGPWRHGLIGAITIGLASALNQALKAFVARERPDLLEPIVVEHGFSFPSGHAAMGMVAYGILGVLVMRSRLPLAVRRGIVAMLAILILLIGVSRVWLGVHYPTDVLAGWTVGAVIVLVYARLTLAVSLEPAEAAVDVDPAAPRSDPPAPG
ncbi:MAG: phosphatase PAP2 family protein [Chloroflexota bacterium]|nr:phosphatase PAP2 family protein [Chloroflexota bacterium]